MTSLHRLTRHKIHAAQLASIIAMFSTVSYAGVGAGGSGGSSGGSGANMSSTSGIADREITRRMQRVQEAQNAINKGDKLLAEGDPEGALNEYKIAIDLLPEAPMTQSWRDFATAKYCNASVALAEQRARGGRYADAKALLNESLARNPEHAASKTLLKRLDDPERYEPALTPEHVKNVEDVNRNLKLGASFENLGDHDSANKSFQEALRIDKYNSAARHNMENVEREKSIYYEAARDHTRVKMLNKVNEAWEDQVPIKFENTGDIVPTSSNVASRYLGEKMQRIIFPAVQFQGASIEEAVEFLRIKSKDLDTIERDPTKRGVNLILKQGQTPSTATISLDLHEVPMAEALRYITELAGMKYKIEPYAVLVVPASDTSTEQFSRTFKVPPDFLSLGSSDAGGGGGAPAPVDPFAPKTPGGGASTGGPALLSGRGNALDILKSQGIPFPEGSSAVFIAATSQLIVKNTQPNLDAVENFVDTLLKKIPQQIYITTKFVEVSQRNTDELGFDWLLGQFNIPGSKGAFGSGGPTNGGNSINGPQVAANYPFLNPGIGTPVGSFPLTQGNRSGSVAVTPNAIDGLLSGAPSTVAPTPGVFALSGVFTDPQFQLVIRALSQKKGVDLMTAPSVTTRSGQRANVEVVREFIYPTEFNPPQIPTQIGNTNGGGGGGPGGGGGTVTIPVTPTTPTAFTMRPVGVRMEVDPVIGPDGFTIDLNLAPEVTEFEGFINYGSPIQTSATDALGNPVTIVLTENRIPQPVFGVRKITTAVTVWDGQTVAMGGLIREDVQEVADKVPILGDLPIVGRLFQNKAQDHFKRNLMIFVTARLIDPSGQPVKQAKEMNAGPAVTAPVGGVSAVPGAGGVLPPIN